MKSFIGYASCVALALGAVFVIAMLTKWLNASALQTQIINPKPGIECVIVSATDSTSVDCWKIGG